MRPDVHDSNPSDPPTEPAPISVVLPLFNHATLLPRALRAIAAQTRLPRQVIVVDDASTDDSAAVAEALTTLFPAATSMLLIRSPANGGVNRALNRGLAAVTSPWVACTAADDWLQPRFVEVMANAIEAFPQAHLVTSTYVEHFEAEARTVVHGPETEAGVWYADHDRFFDAGAVAGVFARGPVTLPVSASVIRTDTLRGLGGFDPDLKWHADWFAAVAIAVRHGFAVVPEPLAVFRVASGTFSGDNVRRQQSQGAVCRALADKLARPEWVDVRTGLVRRPSPFAPFIHYMLTTLARSPRRWWLFAPLLRWWLGQVARGRRPGRLRALVARAGLRVAPR